MYRRFFTIALFGAALGAFGCGSSGVNKNTNVNTEVKIDPANMPPGLSASPLPTTGTPIPGIPTNGAPLPIGKSPTPGIPSQAELKKGVKPGLTPTPGIPDQKSIREQTGQPPVDETTKPPTGNDQPKTKNKRKLGGKL